MDLILTVAFLHLLACLSPGPDIFLVVLNSIRHGWRSGLATTAGILAGVCVHITLGISGISYLLTRGPEVQRGVGLLGGLALAYLGSLGIAHWRRTPRLTSLEGTDLPVPSGGNAFAQGLAVNLLNPKALLYFLSIFSVLLGPDLPATVKAASGLTILLVQATAFSAVAFLVDQPVFKRHWIHLQTWLDLGISLLLLLLGLTMALRSLLLILSATPQ